MIEYQIKRGIMKYRKCLSFYASQIIDLYLNSIISANYKKELRGIQLMKSLQRGLKLYCKISSVCVKAILD